MFSLGHVTVDNTLPEDGTLISLRADPERRSQLLEVVSTLGGLNFDVKARFCRRLSRACARVAACAWAGGGATDRQLFLTPPTGEINTCSSSSPSRRRRRSAAMRSRARSPARWRPPAQRRRISGSSSCGARVAGGWTTRRRSRWHMQCSCARRPPRTGSSSLRRCEGAAGERRRSLLLRAVGCRMP